MENLQILNFDIKDTHMNTIENIYVYKETVRYNWVEKIQYNLKKIFETIVVVEGHMT